MDKKQQQFSRQGSSKGLSTDSRKSSELFSKKPWPKSSRRRENPNCIASKNDSQRSSDTGPAKTRPNVDKRPKARGGPTGAGNVCSPFENMPSSSSGLAFDEKSVVEIPDSATADHFYYELNSVYAAGSKKKNLNHLLNFHYGPRDSDNYSGLNVFGKSANSRTYVKKQKYNKEQYLQANFQFVVNWKARTKITSSPDTLVDWNLIEQINIQTTEEPQCPICLYPPVAAKLTRCGHAYCWPCILHYLALTDKPWRKCPICYEAIHLNDLKSTTIVQQINFSVGNNIDLQLMQRKKGSLFIEKYTNLLSPEELPLYSAADDTTKFAKFIIANRPDVLAIIEREENELATCNSEDNCPEFVFTQQAFDLLKERKDEINKEINMCEEYKNYGILLPKPEKLNLKETITIIEETENTGEEHERNAKYYHFYQSMDGQNVFLHPINVKMLQACYGSLDQAPLVIRAKILQKEHHSMDEYHRRKFTCLGHLPLTCHFEVVEVLLLPPIVSEDIMNIFQDDILQRKRARQKRDRDEKKRETKINAINDRQMGKLLSSTAKIDLSSSHEFPTCGFEETLFGLSNQFDTVPIDVPIQPSSLNRNTYSSVANSVGSPKEFVWPSLGGGATSSLNTAKEFSSGRESVYTRSMMTSDRYSECESLNESIEEFHPPPNLGDVLAEAISQKHNNFNKTENCGNKKTKKKNRKMLLFSTGMNYNQK